MHLTSRLLRTTMTSPTRHLISHLILDYDETLTTHDTILPLLTAASNLQHQTSGTLIPTTSLTTPYLTSYTSHIKSYPHSRNTLTSELRFLNSLLPIERASINRIEASGIFRNLSLNELVSEACKGITIRNGVWQDLIGPARAAGIGITICSVNWCVEMMSRSLQLAARREGVDEGDEAVDQWCEHVTWLSNGLERSKEDFGRLNGEMSRGWKCDNEEGEEEEEVGIWVARHKREVLEKRLGAQEGLKVYVGDSTTDLEALCWADVGIVVGDKLDKTAWRVGIDLVPFTTMTLGEFAEIPKDLERPMFVKVQSIHQLGWFLNLEPLPAPPVR